METVPFEVVKEMETQREKICASWSLLLNNLSGEGGLASDAFEDTVGLFSVDRHGAAAPRRLRGGHSWLQLFLEKPRGVGSDGSEKARPRMRLHRSVPHLSGLFPLVSSLQFLYIPCLLVMLRPENLRFSSFKIMLFLGVLDLLSSLVSGEVPPVSSLRESSFVATGSSWARSSV